MLACFAFLQAAPEVCGIPRLGLKSELWLLAYLTATESQDRAVSETFSRAHGNDIHNPLREARDQIHILMDTNQFHNPLSLHRNS